MPEHDAANGCRERVYPAGRRYAEMPLKLARIASGVRIAVSSSSGRLMPSRPTAY